MPRTAGQSVPPVVAAFLSRKPVIDGLPNPEIEALRKTTSRSCPTALRRSRPALADLRVACAVLCTPPAARIDGETHPDFARPEFASAFAGTPVFVFHGRKDNSAPFGDAQRMVDALGVAGARVTFLVEDETGHGMPNADSTQAFLRWVDRSVRS